MCLFGAGFWTDESDLTLTLYDVIGGGAFIYHYENKGFLIYVWQKNVIKISLLSLQGFFIIHRLLGVIHYGSCETG